MLSEFLYRSWQIRVERKNNSSFAILIYVILNFLNIGRSTFDYSKFCTLSRCSPLQGVGVSSGFVLIWIDRAELKELGGFQRFKTGTFLLYFFFYISNEIFYSNSLPYKRYIFDKYFVKFLLQNFENSVIGTSSPVTLQKKVLSA